LWGGPAGIGRKIFSGAIGTSRLGDAKAAALKIRETDSGQHKHAVASRITIRKGASSVSILKKVSSGGTQKVGGEKDGFC